MMLNIPKISVIVPVYNSGAYLAPCIRSVLAQTYADFELILVDDASTDDSLSVCRGFSDRRIRVVVRERNGGLSQSRNAGVERAMGEYILFVDADDRLHPQALECLMSAADKGCGISVSSLMRVPAESTLNEAPFSPIESPRFEVFEPVDLIEKGLYQELLVNSSCGVLYRASIMKTFRFRDTRYEDLDSFYRLFPRATKIAYFPTSLYAYTENPGSYTRTFSPDRAVVLDVVERIVEYMMTNYPRLVRAAQDRALSAAFNIFALISEYKADLPEIESRCKRIIRRYRWQSLVNSRVRMKNKLGILITYVGGFQLLKIVARVCKIS